MAKWILFIVTIFSSLTSSGQAPISYSSSEILLHLKKLNVLGSVLYIAAHPDDENTRLLAYLANDKLFRTGYLSLTRGDGGQNLIGDEQGVELGLIRTQELLSARRIDGAEQFFSRAYDFGFSKNPEETFKVWDKNKILSDVVWVIRKFQPDVIITRFPTTGEGGHGHHTASAILAGEAYEAAADPNKFPEQLLFGVKPWKVKRLLWNTFNFGGNNTQKEDQLKIEVGGYNALMGKSYGEIAAESRSQHKSQGFGVPRSRGSQLEYFKTIKGDPPARDLMNGVDETWNRVEKNTKETELIKNLVNHAIQNYALEHPENSIPDLVSLYKSIAKLGDGYWKLEKLKEVVKLIEQCSGLFIEATTTQPFVVQGDSLKVNLLLNNREGVNAKHPSANLADKWFNLRDELKKNINLRQTITILVDPNTISQPYWLEKPLDKGNFVVDRQDFIGKPENDPPLIKIMISIDGENISFYRPLQYKTNDPVRGELYQPLVILPKIEVNYSSKTYLTINKNPVKVRVMATSNTTLPINYTIKNIHSQNVDELISAASMPAETVSTFSADNGLADYREIIKAVASDGKNSWSAYRKTIQYDHIPTIVYFPPAEAQLVAVDLKISGHKIGYIAGAGDKVPDALELMGYTVTMLSQKDIAVANLKKFDAIITGVRAYNVHEWISKDHDILMEYIKEGGVLLVQYNVNGLNAKIGPYPFTITGHRITDEEAVVTFLASDHPVMNFPNKIIQKDFEGWIQERSTYNAESLDPAYQTIFSMKDPGEAEQKGSLIIADYGKGKFIYSGLVFFRELPAGVPGAYRLFANLLAPRQMTNKGSLNR